MVTKDADLYDLSNVYGQPPKIIWLKLITANLQIKTSQNLACILALLTRFRPSGASLSNGESIPISLPLNSETA
ncbi:MAG: hypothetical protein HOO92_09750 [Methylococcaceae bacterium]|nr:hypothetical protein [Methylococcaceae bacterium]